MSVVNVVVLDRNKLISSKQWAAAIRASGFDMTFDSSFEPRSFRGFLPCKYQGKDGGFEYLADDLDIKDFEGITSADLGDRNLVVTLTTHANFRELMTSVIASSVLCATTDGLLLEGGELPFVDAASAIERAKLEEPEIIECMKQNGQ